MALIQPSPVWHSVTAKAGEATHRRQHGLTASLLLTAALLLSGCNAASQSAPPQTWHSTQLGLCEDYPEETRSLPRARSDLAAARAAGAKVLRIAFGWDAMEPKRGVYDWSFWDEFVPLSVEEYGLQLIPCACYTPAWAASDPGPNFWRSPPRDAEDFARFMTALVNRYRKYIRSWELWNEPDNPAYWLGTPRQFGDLVRAGSRAVRAADPAAIIVLGGIAGETDFLEAMFATERIAPAVDVVNIHSYFETWHPDPIESLPRYVERVAEIVREHGEDEPLWMAETGYSSVNGRPNVSEVYHAHFQGEHTDAAQANALVRTAVLALATGQLPLFAWYRINDLPTTEDVIGDDNNRHLGVRTIAGAPKPAFAAFKQLTTLFNQPYRIIVPQITITANIGPPPQVHAFALADGRHIVAAWLAIPGRPDLAATHPPPDDPRRADVRIRIPVTTNQPEVRTMNAVGQPIPPPRAQSRIERGQANLHFALRGGELLWCVVE